MADGGESGGRRKKEKKEKEDEQRIRSCHLPGCRASPEPANQAVIPFLCESGKQRNFVSNNDFPRDRQWSGKQGSEGVKDSEEGREKEREREREKERERAMGR